MMPRPDIAEVVGREAHKGRARFIDSVPAQSGSIPPIALRQARQKQLDRTPGVKPRHPDFLRFAGALLIQCAAGDTQPGLAAEFCQIQMNEVGLEN